MAYIFTSESVGEGHPDKVCDQISDSVLDEALRQDKNSRVACEVFASSGLMVVGGEITTHADIDIVKLVRNTLKDIGYNHPSDGMDSQMCSVLSAINSQSPDIAMGVNEDQTKAKKQGAGDQGMVFGFACKETQVFMPAPLYYSHELMKQAAKVRKDKTISFLKPDAKCQISFLYEDGKPKKIATVVLSHQHAEREKERFITHREIEEALMEEVVKKALPSELLDSKTRYFINPTGRFVIGGPLGDTGLTGRKIIVDTYGGAAPHGGGAFSGKDPSKIDRSAAYMARYIAKNVVAAELCDRCAIEIAYAIGVAEPVSLLVESYGTAKVDERAIEKAIGNIFDLTPSAIIEALDLKRPIYKPTSVYGHFGRAEFSWEKMDKIEALKSALSLI